MRRLVSHGGRSYPISSRAHRGARLIPAYIANRCTSRSTDAGSETTERAERRGHQEVDEFAGLGVHAEFRTHRRDVVVEFGDGRRHPVRSPHPADDGLLGQVGVLLGDGQPTLGALVGAQDHPRDAGVHPGDELGVQGPVRHTVRTGPADVRVDLVDAVDEPRRGRGVAEGGGQHVAEGGAGPLERILPVVRKVLDTCDHRRVQDLQHDRGQSGLGYRCEVGVDLPGHAARTDQAGIAGGTTEYLRVVVPAGGRFEVVDDAALQ